MFQPDMFESYYRWLDTTGARSSESEMLRMTNVEGFKNKSGTGTMEPGPSNDEAQDPNGDDDNDNNDRLQKKKHCNRFTQRQTQGLEALFKEYPHPDAEQKRKLGRELGLKPSQTKYWFQNKRAQLRTRHERHGFAFLKAENERLKAECTRYREALSTATCPNCGGPATGGKMTLEERHLKFENDRLKEEMGRIFAIASKHIEKPLVPSYPYLPSHSSSCPQNQFPVRSGPGKEMYEGIDLTRPVSIPSEKRSIYHQGLTGDYGSSNITHPYLTLEEFSRPLESP